jgi:hypothetical protein
MEISIGLVFEGIIPGGRDVLRCSAAIPVNPSHGDTERPRLEDVMVGETLDELESSG